MTFLFHRQPQSYITPSPSLSPNWNGDADHGSVEANSQLSPRRARMIIAVKGADWRNDCDNKSGQTSPFCAYFLRHSIQLENSAIWRLLVSITDVRDIIARVHGKNFKRSPIDFSSSYFSLIAASKVGELELRQKALRNGQSVGVVIFHHGSHIYIWQEALAWWMWHWIH